MFNISSMCEHKKALLLQETINFNACGVIGCASSPNLTKSYLEVKWSQNLNHRR